MGGLSGIVGGLISGLQGQPSYNMDALLNTINQAGTYQRGIINALPPEIQANLAKYAQAQNAAGQKYQGQVEGQAQDYLSKISGLYGPNSPAAQAQLLAARQNIYSTVPGTQNAIRNALAATGGLQRGGAATALAYPYTAAASQYGNTAAGIVGQQTAAQQQATAGALATVNSMEAGLFQQLFGMSKEQAAQILQTGNQALRDQLSALINQSQQQTNQTLNVEGVQAQQDFANTANRQATQNAVWTGLAGAGLGGVQSLLPPGNQSSIFQGLMNGFTPGSGAIAAPAVSDLAGVA